MEGDANFFLQSEINCYCKWFVLSCTDSCRGREESMRPRVSRLTTIVLGSAQLLGNVFPEVLLWSLVLHHPSVRTALQLRHSQLFPPGYHLTLSPMSVGRLQLSLRAADMEHLYYGWWRGSCCSDIVMFQVLTSEFLQYCCTNSRCYLLPGLLTLIAKNLSPAMRKLAEENLCSHFSCFSADSAFLCKPGSRI